MNWKTDLDWDVAIKRNSEALNGIIAALFAMLGLKARPRFRGFRNPLHRAVLRVLRPAESAVRRLIVIAARGLVVKLAPSRPMPKGQIIGKGGGSRLPSFQLFDTRKYFPELQPAPGKDTRRIHRASISSTLIPGGALWPRPARGRSRPAARWPGQCHAPHAAGSRPSSSPSRTCPARPGAWPAGG